ncbi:carbonic anhydrase [Coleofasciculus sp. FACHB-64]|uniref:carbonic anhydrase n=1 Tax=Cyanophyceae TaxID=3028117 RepID=UPI0016890810|nr:MULTISPECIES: carbonic anhydrase [unclassified Coleofasciculus]MBD1838524.1 carbonic anhydrase [Coleofasciculus sp. FACHB-501]MBD1896917.1 carbonic anhydrase [Coleofasciculus sp. FACHB-129]MBD1900786.1 carbonic anhydrase [Coleofasciculus sp. FACHB-125]MBD2045758.1 carbonic anhydrase [Coleofasciculus sp. FACHB-64]
MNQNNGLMGRRNFLNLTGNGGIALMAAVTGSAFWGVQANRAIAATVEPPSPDAALKRLMEGNQRFVQHKAKHPDQSEARVKEIAQAQHPFATLLTCADSRVSAEILFDEGLGDLFDIRVAGNIVTPEVLGSLEYAVAILGTPVIMVLGHERCGAVTAAVQGERLPGSMNSFVKAIKPAIAKTKDESGDPVDNAVVANVRYQIEKLKQNSTIVSERLLDDKLKIVGGRYDLDTGKVTLI